MKVIYSGGEGEHPNFLHFSGCETPIDHAFLVLDDEGKKTLIVNEMNRELAEKVFKGEVVSTRKQIEEIKKICGKELEIDLSSVDGVSALEISKKFRIKDISRELAEERMKKKKNEIDLITTAVKKAEECIKKTSMEGKSEEEAAREFLSLTYMIAEGPAFRPIIASGTSTRHPHYTPIKRRIKEFWMADVGVKFKGYCSDITSMWFKDGRKEAKEDYEKVGGIFWEIVDFITDNSPTSKEVAAKTSEIYKRMGEREMHSIGHGIGREVHELPWFSKKGKAFALKGCVFTIEPGIYRKNWGVRFERCIYYDGKKARVI